MYTSHLLLSIIQLNIYKKEYKMPTELNNIITKNIEENRRSRCSRIKRLFLTECAGSVRLHLTDTKIMKMGDRCETIKNIWLLCKTKNKLVTSSGP